MGASRTAWKKWAIYCGIAPALLLYIIMGLGPSIATFVLSFTNISGIPNTPWKFIGLANYKEFFFLQNYRDVISSFKNTFIFSGAVTFFQNGIALLVAVVLNNKKVKGRNFYRAVIFLPVVLGVMVTALSWSLVFNPDGPISKFIGLFGLSSAFFGDRAWAFPLIIFCQCWMAMGYSMVIFLAGLQSISGDVYEAADIDGATPSQAFRYITFPLLWPTITVNVILAIIGSLSSFQIILLTTGGNFDTATLAMRVFNSAFGVARMVGGGGLRQGYAAAQGMILFVIILIFTLIFQTLMTRKEREV